MKKHSNEFNDIPEPADEPGDSPSKSQRKRDANRALELAKALMLLPQRKRDRYELSADIVDALNFGDSIRSNGAKKRQLHYIGKLLRKSDNYETYWQIHESPHATASTPDQTDDVQEAAADNKIRDRLLQDLAGTMGDLRSQYPNANTQLIRQLVNRIHQSADGTDAEKKAQLKRALDNALTEGRLK